jgi:ubiquinone/menaquinone biosynthesis C-methylase UbiE
MLTPMPDARDIYRSAPETYDALVSYEDHAGRLLEAIRSVVRLDAADVVEVGAGTGRVTRLLAPYVRSIRAFEREPAMLAVARAHLQRLGMQHCLVALADNTQLPVSDACAHIAVAGWTYGHQTVWEPQAWQTPIRAALAEMLRVLRPGGTAIVIETLGSGHSEPFEPPLELARYYAMLEHDYGFTRTWIRTDYAFPSNAEGERLLHAFFGAEAARAFAASRGTRLPECTGIWSRRL